MERLRDLVEEKYYELFKVVTRQPISQQAWAVLARSREFAWFGDLVRMPARSARKKGQGLAELAYLARGIEICRKQQQADRPRTRRPKGPNRRYYIGIFEDVEWIRKQLWGIGICDRYGPNFRNRRHVAESWNKRRPNNRIPDSDMELQSIQVPCNTLVDEYCWYPWDLIAAFWNLVHPDDPTTAAGMSKRYRRAREQCMKQSCEECREKMRQESPARAERLGVDRLPTGEMAVVLPVTLGDADGSETEGLRPLRTLLHPCPGAGRPRKRKT